MDEVTREEKQAAHDELREEIRARAGGDGMFDFGVPYGWIGLVRELDLELQKVVPGYTLGQAKSKFGGLRYYADPPEGMEWGDPAWARAGELIDKAEERSFEVCMSCGEPGETASRNGWLSTLCPEHAEKQEAGRG